MRYFILLFLFAHGFIFCSGCASYEVMTWKSPDFNIRSYKRAFIKENDAGRGELEFEIYLNRIGIETETYSKENILHSEDLFVEFNTTWGLSRPYGNPIPYNFTYPKYITVEFFDAITKKKLLKTTCTRGFWANISPDGESWNYPVLIIKNVDKTLGLDIVNQDYPNSGTGLK